MDSIVIDQGIIMSFVLQGFNT